MLSAIFSETGVENTHIDDVLKTPLSRILHNSIRAARRSGNWPEMIRSRAKNDFVYSEGHQVLIMKQLLSTLDRLPLNTDSDLTRDRGTAYSSQLNLVELYCVLRGWDFNLENAISAKTDILNALRNVQELPSTPNPI